MHKLRNTIDLIVERVLVILMALLTLDVLWQVVSRYLTPSPSSWTEELARFLLIWVAILGAAYMTGKKAHISIDLISSKLEKEANERLQKFIHILILLFGLFVLVIGGINLINITLTNGQTSTAMRVPLGYIYLVIPLSGILIMFYSILHITSTEPTETDHFPNQA